MWVRQIYLYLFVVSLTSSTCQYYRVTCSSEGQEPGSLDSDSVSTRNVMKLRIKWLKAPAASNTDGAHRWRSSKILFDTRWLTHTLPVSHSAHARHCRQKRAGNQCWCVTLTRFSVTTMSCDFFYIRDVMRSYGTRNVTTASNVVTLSTSNSDMVSWSLSPSAGLCSSSQPSNVCFWNLTL